VAVKMAVINRWQIVLAREEKRLMRDFKGLDDRNDRWDVSRLSSDIVHELLALGRDLVTLS
jgi:hypothetical protein